jgi:hypothetical protein
MERVKPAELHTAARVADALVYAAGIAGVVAGGLLFRDGQAGFALVAWVLTFIAGAGLRLAAWAAKALAQLLVRSEQMERDLAELLRASAPPAPPAPDHDDVPDPYRRWGGGWH